MDHYCAHCLYLRPSICASSRNVASYQEAAIMAVMVETTFNQTTTRYVSSNARIDIYWRENAIHGSWLSRQDPESMEINCYMYTW